MAISLKHSFTSPKSDGGDDTLVRPSDWNAEHNLTQTTGTLLGRTTAGTGATEEITPGSGLSFTALTLAVDPAGSNTHIQFNDSEVLGGSAGFTFDKDTNNVVIGNTITVGTNFIANGSGAYPLNNTSGIALGSTTQRWNLTGNTISVTGTITSSGNITGSNVNGAIGYFTGLVNAANFITTGNANSGSVYVTGGVYPQNNTTGTALGSTTARWNLTGNTISVTGTITSSGNITGSNVNGAIGYFTGLVNAANFTTTGNANAGNHYATSGGMYPAANGTGQALGDATHRWVITANSLVTSGGITTSGGASPTSNTVGQALGTTTQRWELVANTIATSGAITSSGGVNPASNSTGTALGTTLARWVIIANSISLSSTVTATGNITTSGNVNGAIGYFTGLVNAAHFTTTGNANAAIHYAGANVYANTTTVRVGNSTVNTTIGNTQVFVGTAAESVLVNSIAVSLTNATVTWNITKPTAAEVSSGDYYLGSDGTWQQPAATTDAAGSDTYVQFNDGGTAFGGTAGFTFTKTTNNITIGNTITVGTNFIANGSGAYPVNNTSGTALGSTTQRWNLTANALVVSGTSTFDGTITNSFDIDPTGNNQSLGDSTHRWILYANLASFSGDVDPISNTQSLGDSTHRWILYANTGSFSGLVTSAGVTSTSHVNTSTYFYAGANVYSNTTTVRVGNSTVETIISNNQITLGTSSIQTVNTATFVTSSGPDTVEDLLISTYRTGEFTYSIKHDSANAYQSGRLVVVNDGSAGHLEEYGVVFTNATAGILGSFNTGANSTHILVQFTPTAALSYTVKIFKTALTV